MRIKSRSTKTTRSFKSPRTIPRIPTLHDPRSAFTYTPHKLDWRLGERRNRGTAFHEAAHAIVAEAHGIKVLAIYIEPVNSDGPKRRDAWAGAVAIKTGQMMRVGLGFGAVVMYCAGLVAELQACPAANKGAIGEHATDDAESALTFSDNDLLKIERAELHCRGFIAKHWREIDRLAQKLLRAGSVRFA